MAAAAPRAIALVVAAAAEAASAAAAAVAREGPCRWSPPCWACPAAAVVGGGVRCVAGAALLRLSQRESRAGVGRAGIKQGA